jgi:hypothetical protein
MPLPFDATLKDLVGRHLADFTALLGLSGPAPTTVLNVDLSTVSAATDLAVGFGDPPDRIADLNFQASADADLPRRVRLYNALLHHRYRVPVHSIVVLLRPAADDAGLTGRLTYQAFPGRGRADFRYEVVRLWEQPAGQLLEGGTGSLPLAVLGRIPAGIPAAAGLQEVIRRVERRLREQTGSAETVRLMTAAYVLAGLRIGRERARDLFLRAFPMRESDTYLAIMEEGAVEVLHRTLLRQGRKKFGPPKKDTKAAVEAITDLARLERMSGRLLDVDSWPDLLATR